MANLPYLAKVILIALVKETQSKNAGSVILRDVYHRFSNILNTFPPATKTRAIYYSDYSRVLNDLKRQSLVKINKQTASSLASYVAETRVSVETPDLADVHLQEASESKQVKKTKGVTKHFKGGPSGGEEDEDGANYLICLNELIEATDVKRALVDEAGDRTAQRLLL